MWISVAILSIGFLCFCVHGLRSGFASLQGLFVSPVRPVTFQAPAYRQLLQKYVKDGLVDYSHMKHSPELNAAVEELKRTSPDNIVNDQDRLAFWINAYNLLTLKAICDRYPISSPRKLGNTYSGEEFLVGGKPITLQDIYFTQIVPMAKRIDVNAIFLACNGTLGSPVLNEYPANKDTLKQDGEAAALRFCNDPRNVLYDPDTKTFAISPWLQWNHELLEKEHYTPHHFVNKFLEPDHKVQVDDVTIMKTYFPNFDWTLNDKQIATWKHK